MASKDTRRLNPGIQVKNLIPGVASKVDPHLVRASSAPSIYANTLTAWPVIYQGANPHFGYALNTSGSLVLLEAA